MKRLFLANFIGCLLLLASCISLEESALPETDTIGAYHRARASMLTEKKINSDVLWVLAQIQSNEPDNGIEIFIATGKKGTRNPHYLPGVFPSEPKIDLPEHTGQGIECYITYVTAPFGQPRDMALYHLANFIAGENSGYVLTHQFLALVFAEQAGLPISKEMRMRKDELHKKIVDEQLQTDSIDCMDLYMERVALILCYGNKKGVDKKRVDPWIQTIIDTQLPDGSWPLSKTTLCYDGATTFLSSPRSHTTALAMLALHSYINLDW